MQAVNPNAIAVIAFNGRFPGARNVDQLWQNLSQGRHALQPQSDADLLAAGASAELLNDPRYVKVSVKLEDCAQFDAAFFGYSAKEAEQMDPQQRLFLEVCWEALEAAGYDCSRYAGAVGVFAGCGAPSYMMNHLLQQGRRAGDVAQALGGFATYIGNGPDFLATRVSYKLGLTGPAMTVQTACSTSLVAVHMASQALLHGECEMALAGGASINFPQGLGYLYQDGMILSPDGVCRPFDAQAAGTVPGNGVGVVLLKRLQDALDDGDQIHAVLLGSAVNNDGRGKIGFTAPSISGQAAVIAEALEIAGVSAASIGYVEAHGTGTELGDPIEIAALTQAFRAAGANGRQTCAIGSLKSNLGHLNAAAGVAGLIKAILAVKHGETPPSLHFSSPNPKIDFANSPFFVNTALRAWPLAGVRRAAVSSLGIGGSNAHVVLEQAPQQSAQPRPGRRWQIVLQSAQHPAALQQAGAELAAVAGEWDSQQLADAASTLAQGRQAFAWRRALCVTDGAGLQEALRQPEQAASLGHVSLPGRRVVFLFPGQGAQYAGMCAGLYRDEAVFRASVDELAASCAPMLGLDLRRLLFPAAAEMEQAQAQLQQTCYTQPALFIIEYSLARLLQSLGLRPAAMLGHSVGEYVAAALAGVFSVQDGLRLVCQRARLMQACAPGAMLAVPLGRAALQDWLTPEIDIAALNAPALSVLAGPQEAIAALQARMQAQGIQARLLKTSHAFHSAMMQPALEEFRRQVAAVPRQPALIPYLSNLSGAWITPQQVQEPDYWAQQLRGAVQFDAGAARLLQDENEAVFIEVGPGNTLASLLRQQAGAAGRSILHCAPKAQAEQEDAQQFAQAIAALWLAGVEIDWAAWYAGQQRRRVALPTYPFQRKRYWIDLNGHSQSEAEDSQIHCAVSAPAYVAPRDELESFLVSLWQEALGGAQIGIDDDFYALGGNSLLATQIVSRIKDSLQIELKLAAFLQAGAIRALGPVLESLAAAHTHQEGSK